MRGDGDSTGARRAGKRRRAFQGENSVAASRDARCRRLLLRRSRSATAASARCSCTRVTRRRRWRPLLRAPARRRVRSAAHPAHPNIDELKAPAPAAAPATTPVRAARPDAELSPSTEQALAALDALEGEAAGGAGDGRSGEAWMAATDVPVRRTRSPSARCRRLDVAKRPGGPQMSPRRGNSSPTQPERAATYATRGARARSAPREGQPVISRRSRDLASLRPATSRSSSGCTASTLS